MQETTSLFQRLGGDAAVSAAVEVFYDKVLADDHLNGFFVGMDMARQRQHMKRFLSLASGGPNAYTGRDMRAAHARLVTTMGLGDSHYDAVVSHLVAALQELGVSPEVVDEVAVVVESVRDDVLNRPPMGA